MSYDQSDQHTARNLSVPSLTEITTMAVRLQAALLIAGVVITSEQAKVAARELIRLGIR